MIVCPPTVTISALPLPAKGRVSSGDPRFFASRPAMLLLRRGRFAPFPAYWHASLLAMRKLCPHFVGNHHKLLRPQELPPRPPRAQIQRQRARGGGPLSVVAHPE